MSKCYKYYRIVRVILISILFVFMVTGRSRCSAKSALEDDVLEDVILADEMSADAMSADEMSANTKSEDAASEEVMSDSEEKTKVKPDSTYKSFHVEEKELVIPDLTEEYDFLFLSDTHVIKLGNSEEEQVIENALPRIEMFRDNKGMVSLGNFPRWMKYANENDFDMVLFGGDIIDFPSEQNLDILEKNLKSLDMPYVYTLGNHDWTYPWEYMTPAGRDDYRPLFIPFIGENPAASITDCEELVILSVDNSSNQVDAEALPVVEEALDIGKPVIVILHVPFSTETLLEKASAVWNSAVSVGMEEEGGIPMNENTLAFQEAIYAEDSPVVCVLAGHVHFPDEDMLTENIMQFVNGAGYLNEATALWVHGESESGE